MDRTVIIYDADCGFCRWSLSKILVWDRHHSLRPVPLQSEEADKLLDGMDPETKMRSWHLVTPDGKIYSGGDAVPHLANLLPGGRPIASLASTLPGPTTRLYRWVADHRDSLARLVGPQRCSVDPAKRRDPQA
jgi:predicted DCC family thiol-disulfide oxidoreductase YuxK